MREIDMKIRGVSEIPETDDWSNERLDVVESHGC
jgi:hypothetical protein